MEVCYTPTVHLFSIMNRIEASFVIFIPVRLFFCLIVPLFNKESILNVPVVAAFLTLDGGLCSSPPAGLLQIDVLRSIIAYWFCGCRDSLDPITTIEWVYIVITVLIACC